MSRAAGLAVGGAILSITVGVLVGLVIHAGQVERADSIAPYPRATATSTQAADADTGAPPLWTTPTDSGPASINYSAPPSAPGGSADTAVAPTVSGDSANGVITSVFTTAAKTTAVTAGTTTGTAGSTASTAGDSAGSPCPTLAARSSNPAGTTVYCQVDQVARTLQWRAVVNKGGCLNQSMVGVGADGKQYSCVLDASGQNHWAPAG